MYTSNYANLKNILPPLTPIAISRGKPRWKGGWLAHLREGVEGRVDDRLAPTWAALKADDGTYDREFAAKLRALDPTRVYAELGENAVLLCFCEPGEFCHRRIVAEWFEFHLGVIVPELGMDRLAAGLQHTTSSYDHWINPEAKHERLKRLLFG